MGAGASLPDTIDEATAQEYAGNRFDATAFQAAAVEGALTRDAFLDASLSKLNKEEVELHLDAVTERLSHNKKSLRLAAIGALQQLDSDVLDSVSKSVVLLLDDRDKDLDSHPRRSESSATIKPPHYGAGRIRQAALETMLKFSAESLALYEDDVADIVCERRVTYDKGYGPNVVSAALHVMSRFKPETLANHEAALVERLSDTSGRVRAAAFDAVKGFSPVFFKQHAEIVISGFFDEEPLVHKAMLNVFSSMPLATQAQYMAYVPCTAPDTAPSRLIDATAAQLATQTPAFLANYAGVIPDRFGELRTTALEALASLPVGTWGAESEESWQRPSQIEQAHDLVVFLKETQRRGTFNRAVWHLVVPAATLILEGIVAAARASEAFVTVLKSVYEHERIGSLKNYSRQLSRVRTEATYFEYRFLLDEITPKLEPRRAECVQRITTTSSRDAGSAGAPATTLTGVSDSFMDLFEHAAKRKQKFDQFLALIARLTGANAQAAPLKGGWRALEKMVFQAGREKGGPLDASRLCDVLRGALNCKSFVEVVSVVDLLMLLDTSLSDAEDATRAESVDAQFHIRMLRVKDRFNTPTSGGWADLLINFVFVDDTQEHVMELQVQHETLLRVRKEGSAHEKYAAFRTAFELLETIERPPSDEASSLALLNHRSSSILPSFVAEQRIAELEDRAKQQEDRIEALEQQVAELQSALQAKN